MAVNKTFNEVKLNVAFTQASNTETTGTKQHAGNIDGSTGTGHEHGEDLAISLGKIKNWYANWDDVVWTGIASGIVLTSNSHTNTIETAALSADVTQTFPATSGTVLNTGTTSVTQVLSSGTKIGTITINGTGTDLYCEKNTDTKVNVTLGTTTKAYLLATSTTPTATAQAITSIADTGVYLDTTAGSLVAGTFTATTSYAIKSGSYTNTISSASVTSSNKTQTLPNTSGTILNTGTTSYTATTASTDAGAYKIGSIKINNSSTDIYGINTGSIVSFTQTVSTGTKLGTITIDGTPTDLYFQDTKVNAKKATTTKAYLLGTSTTLTTSDQQVTAIGDDEIYLTTTAGELRAKTFNENGTTLANKYAAKSHNHDGVYVPVKPDGTNDLFDGNNIIQSVYLPSYVDDVLEGYYKDGQFYPTNSTFTVTTSQPSNWATTYTNYFTRSGTSPNYVYTRLTSAEAPTWAASTYYSLSGTAMTGQSDTIYIDIGVDPAESYRWTGSTYASMKSPTIHAVSDVVKKSNGVITKSYTDGTASADITVYEHPTTAGNKHIPSGGSTGQYLKYGGSSGTAAWSAISGSDVPVFTAATSGAAGTQGTVPAPAQSTYDANGNRHYLRSDGVWSNDPVTTYDTIQLNVV